MGLRQKRFDTERSSVYTRQRLVFPKKMELALNAPQTSLGDRLENTQPTPLALALEPGVLVTAHNDRYSDRLRCDHPTPEANPEMLGAALIETAQACDRSRVVVLAPAHMSTGLEAAGMRTEAVVPGFYAGTEDCAIAGYWLDASRAESPCREELEAVKALIDARRDEPPRPRPPLETHRASTDDAADIAELLGETFSEYPTPSDDPLYISSCIEDGTPFRVVREHGEVVACASADLVRDARTAELTDCATRPEHRGRGLMQALLTDLMDDLRRLRYPTAFTLARARIPGINLAFQRLGFQLSGTMVQSCRIGDGLEDMNVWSRRLLPSAP